MKMARAPGRRDVMPDVASCGAGDRERLVQRLRHLAVARSDAAVMGTRAHGASDRRHAMVHNDCCSIPEGLVKARPGADLNRRGGDGALRARTVMMGQSSKNMVLVAAVSSVVAAISGCGAGGAGAGNGGSNG